MASLLSKEDFNRFCKMAARPWFSNGRLAKIFSITKVQVVGLISRHGSAIDEYRRPTRIAVEAKERNCLMCSTKFTSEHPGNRICPQCKATAAWGTGEDYSAGGNGGWI